MRINVEIVARRCSLTSEMKYLLLKAELGMSQRTKGFRFCHIVDERSRVQGH